MATGRIFTCLYLDGAEIGRWHGDNQPKRSYAFYTNFRFPVLSGGSHTIKIQADCTNAVAEANENDNTWQMAFTWQVPILVSGQQGFDACTAPSLNQMRTWWQHSPYYDVNIYIGGISRGCGQPNLSASWIQSVNSMGWRLIPTWVGPQAPCWRYRYPMSSSPSTAYNQGRAEADSASNVAGQLGLAISGQSGTVIYYDLEYFPTTNSSCLQATKSFVNGWVSRLHELGHRAGVYSNSSILPHFSSIPNPPDDIWAAWWTYNYYNPSVTVWGLLNLPDNLWANHQRIRQYAGGHNETWGGVTINIDSNVLDGHVAGTVPDPSAAGQAVHSAEVAQLGAHVKGLDFTAPDQGWVLVGESLWQTTDAGETWRQIGPHLSTSEQPGAAFFLSPQQGWMVTTNPVVAAGQADWQIYATQDGGEQWKSSALPTSDTPDVASSGQASLHFVDSQHGWIVLPQAGSSNFRTGRFFRTQDGGASWQEADIPIGEPVMFLTPDIGFTAGGANGSEFYRTADGGLSWEPQNVTRDLAGGEIPQYSLPTRQDDGTTLLSVFIRSESNPRLERYLTRDNGESWERESSQSLQEVLQANSLPGTAGMLANNTQQATGQPFPEGTFLADFTDSLNGWALSTSGDCQGQKGSQPLQCDLHTRLWSTQDGGASWIEIHIPEN